MSLTGPPRSFDEAFDDLAVIAYRVAHRLLGTRAEAEDVAQEALARAYARWWRIRTHAEPWVARVAANLALDLVRSHGRSRRAPLDDRAQPPAGGAPLDAAAVTRLELARLLDGLPRRQREVLVLRYLADRSEADTARALGTSVGTVKRHAHRGLASLRATLEATDPDPLADPGAA